MTNNKHHRSPHPYLDRDGGNHDRVAGDTPDPGIKYRRSDQTMKKASAVSAALLSSTAIFTLAPLPEPSAS